jgi:exosortase sorting signal-containing protein
VRKSLILSIIVITITFGFSQLSLAVCESAGPDQFVCNALAPNPDPDGVQQAGNDNGVQVDVLPNGNIDTSLAGGGSGNSNAINLGNGADTVNVNNANVIGQTRGMRTSDGADQITIKNSNVSSPVDTILLGGANDNLQIIDSIVRATNSSITVDLEGGDDTLVVERSTISALFDVTVTCRSGNDEVTVRNSTISNQMDDFPLTCGDGNDVIRLGGFSANIPGGIDCDDGEGDNAAGFDTLIFELLVSPNQVAGLTEQIENLPAPDGSITINGTLYEYRNCDEIVAALRDSEQRPIPTLSQWGLLAMAGVLGIIGIIVLRRRGVVA